jgi:hypothetical protein
MGTQHAVNYEEVDDETTMMAFEVKHPWRLAAEQEPLLAF